MNNRTVAHEWANQTRDSRRGSNFYFEGRALYSYGAHFVVGYLADVRGGRIALMNSKSYSSSTAKHQNYARAALDISVKRFYVPAPGVASSDIAENILYFLREIETGRAALLASRKYITEKENSLADMVRTAAEYLKLFPLCADFSAEVNAARRKIRRYASANWSPTAGGRQFFTPAERAALDRKIERAAELRRTEDARRAARVDAEAIEKAGQMLNWVNGEPGVRAPSYSYGDGPTRLRIHGPAVETSRGAVVSVRAARIAWAAIKAGRSVVGMILDGYTVTAFNGVLKIGCHTIDRAEVDRIGAQLDAMPARAEGVTKAEADAALGLNPDGTARPGTGNPEY